MKRWKRHKALCLREKHQGSRSMFLIVILMALFGQVAAQDNIDTVTDLIKQLKSQNEFVRSSAAKALGRMGSEAKQVIPALTEALKDQSEYVRIKAASALGEMGPEAKQAIPALTERLNDEDHLVRDFAARAIERLE